MNPLLTQLLTNAQVAQGYKAQATPALPAASQGKTSKDTQELPSTSGHSDKEFSKTLAKVQEKESRPAQEIRSEDDSFVPHEYTEETDTLSTDTGHAYSQNGQSSTADAGRKILPGKERPIETVVPAIKQRLSAAGLLPEDMQNLEGADFLQALLSHIQQPGTDNNALELALRGVTESLGTDSLDALTALLESSIAALGISSKKTLFAPILANEYDVPVAIYETSALTDSKTSGIEGTLLTVTPDTEALPQTFDEMLAASANGETSSEMADDDTLLALQKLFQTDTGTVQSATTSTTEKTLSGSIVSAFAQTLQKNTIQATGDNASSAHDLEAFTALNTEDATLDMLSSKNPSSLLENATSSLPTGHPKQLTDIITGAGIGIAHATEVKGVVTGAQPHQIALDALYPVQDSNNIPKTAVDTARENLLNGKSNAERPGAGEQVLVQINRALKNGQHSISVKLDPAHLGKVDVRLDLQRDGKTSIAIIADRQETLDLLQRDARMLERSLHEMGLSMERNSLSFDLRGGQHHQPQGEENNFAGGTGQLEEATEKTGTSAEQVLYHAALRIYGKGYIPIENGVDIRA